MVRQSDVVATPPKEIVQGLWMENDYDQTRCGIEPFSVMAQYQSM
jgi:hypothetical protein